MTESARILFITSATDAADGLPSGRRPTSETSDPERAAGLLDAPSLPGRAAESREARPWPVL
jgi:hypothetical protein